MKPVDSSQINAIGYDKELQLLHVQFKNGGTYAYEGVPHDMADALVKSESVGGFLHRHIKDHFPHKKLEAA